MTVKLLLLLTIVLMHVRIIYLYKVTFLVEKATKVPIGFRPATLDDVSHYGDVLAESLQKVNGRYYARGEYIYRPGFKMPILVNATDQPACGVNNGGCSHLCVVKNDERMCHCPGGLFLDNDDLTCIDHLPSPIQAPPPTPTHLTSLSTTGNLQHDCNLPVDIGGCPPKLIMWFYDGPSETCKEFGYGGCGGNGNRFKSRLECEKFCGRFARRPTKTASAFVSTKGTTRPTILTSQKVTPGAITPKLKRTEEPLLSPPLPAMDFVIPKAPSRKPKRYPKPSRPVEIAKCPKCGQEYQVKVKVTNKGKFQNKMNDVASDTYQSIDKEIRRCAMQLWRDCGNCVSSIRLLGIGNTRDGILLSFKIRFKTEGDNYMTRFENAVETGRFCQYMVEPQIIMCDQLCHTPTCPCNRYQEMPCSKWCDPDAVTPLPLRVHKRT